MKDYSLPADAKTIKKVIDSLKANGINALIAENGEDAKKKALEMIPEGSEVMTMSSVTIDKLGISEVINESGKYDSVKKKLASMNRETDLRKMQEIGSTPEYAIGSVHAVTEDGKIVVASNTGSQLPAYAYGSSHVVWVVGAQKIVKDMDEAMDRLYKYTLPLESARLKSVYGMESNVSKLLIFNKEQTPNRLNMVIIKEAIGF